MGSELRAIMFADVAGSTAIYDAYGDQKAEQAIGDCVSKMIEIVKANQGRVIKTIGDEVMAEFLMVDDAFRASTAIQSATEDMPLDKNKTMQVRVGMHYGAVIDKDNDIYGDAVNVAARMAGIAKARQIITSADLIEQLDDQYQSMVRLFDRAKVKGKEEELAIYQVVWDQQNMTNILTSQNVQAIKAGASIMTLNYAGKEMVITGDEKEGEFTIGRGEQCDLVVKSDFSSRAHLAISFRRGKFILADHSTNGTYVSNENTNGMFLRREEVPCLGEGVISLGEKINPSGEHLIAYNVLSAS